MSNETKRVLFWVFVTIALSILAMLYCTVEGCSPSKLATAKEVVNKLSPDTQREIYEHLSIILGIKDSFWGAYSQWTYITKDIAWWILGSTIAILLATLYLSKRYYWLNKWLLSIGVFVALTLLEIAGGYSSKFFGSHSVYWGEIILNNFFGLVCANLIYNAVKNGKRIIGR